MQFVKCEVIIQTLLSSPLQTSELFYLCKVLSSLTAAEEVPDANNHSILERMKFVKVHYMEKLKEKKELLYYKLLLEKEIYVLLKQIFYPCS